MQFYNLDNNLANNLVNNLDNNLDKNLDNNINNSQPTQLRPALFALYSKEQIRAGSCLFATKLLQGVNNDHLRIIS